jgi:hypothetical protein
LPGINESICNDRKHRPAQKSTHKGAAGPLPPHPVQMPHICSGWWFRSVQMCCPYIYTGRIPDTNVATFIPVKKETIVYGYPRAHYPGGYRNRLLRGPPQSSRLVLHDARRHAVQGIKGTSTRIGVVEYSYPCTSSNSPSNRLVTLPPGLYKVRQEPLSRHLHHIVNNITPIKSYALHQS